MINVLYYIELVLLGVFVTSPIWIPILLSIIIFISRTIDRKKDKFYDDKNNLI